MARQSDLYLHGIGLQLQRIRPVSGTSVSCADRVPLHDHVVPASLQALGVGLPDLGPALRQAGRLLPIHGYRPRDQRRCRPPVRRHPPVPPASAARRWGRIPHPLPGRPARCPRPPTPRPRCRRRLPPSCGSAATPAHSAPSCSRQPRRGGPHDGNVPAPVPGTHTQDSC